MINTAHCNQCYKPFNNGYADGDICVCNECHGDVEMSDEMVGIQDAFIKGYHKALEDVRYVVNQSGNMITKQLVEDALNKLGNFKK